MAGLQGTQDPGGGGEVGVGEGHYGCELCELGELSVLILGLKFQVREIIWGLIFLCPHKFISVQKFLVDS